MKVIVCIHDPINLKLKTVLTFSVVKVCPLNIDKQNVATGEENDFFDVLNMLSDNRTFYVYPAAIINLIKIKYRNKI